MKVLHLNLTVFSNKGGIEQVAKNWMYSFSELQKSKRVNYKAFALYDYNYDSKYIQKNHFKFFKGNKVYFGITTLFSSLNKDVLILSHLHLSLFALLAKLLNPKLKIWVQLHGIEAWDVKSRIQILALRISDKIFPVSNFTKEKVLKKFPDLDSKIEIIQNTLDPYHSSSITEDKISSSRTKLKIEDEIFALISVGRMRSDEAYKGYDRVIEALSQMNTKNIKYYLIGKTDEIELNRINKLVKQYKLENVVEVIGFVNDVELTEYYYASNLLVMPSVGEGFGLVFIDSMANGLPVIAGNQDGSVDALKNSKLSVSINPYNIQDIKTAINQAMQNPSSISDRIEMANYYSKIYNASVLSDQLSNMCI